MIKRYDVIIVGSGLAGLAAADLLSIQGLRVLVVDDNAHTGGQLLRSPPHDTTYRKRFEPDRHKYHGIKLVNRLQRRKVRFLNGAQVLGVYPEQTLLVEDRLKQVSEYRADALILATGARERHLPFKGWTLPGVMTTGAAQIMMKSSGIIPGEKTLIGGCSPLMLVLAAEILANGGKVQAVLDQSVAVSKLKALTAGPAVLPKIIEGAFYLSQMLAARVPIHQGVRIVEARGRQHLETVIVARIDDDGNVIQGAERIYPVNTLAVGYGFSPNIELPQQAGCMISHNTDKGGWYVEVDASMATSVAGIYAVGETNGIGGAGKSFIEGKIAAWDILYRHDLVVRKQYEKNIRQLIYKRKQQVRYGRFINQLCQLEPDCYTGIPDETIICRCEEITMGEIRQQLRNGFTTMNGIKRATRCGMGRCQGRTCGPILFEVISSFVQQNSSAIGAASARSPVKSVSLGSLANMTRGNDDGNENPELG